MQNYLRIFTVVFCFVLVFKVSAQPDFGYNKNYGKSSVDRITAAIQYSKGGTVGVGYTASSGAGSNDFLLIKFTSAGDTLFYKTFGTAADERGYSVRETPDGGFIMVGRVGTASPDVYIVKADSNGTQLWAKTYDLGGSDLVSDIQVNQDGTSIAIGYKESGAFYKGFFLTVSATGDSLSTKLFGINSVTAIFASIRDYDNNLLVAGYTSSGGNDAYIGKFSPSLELIKEISFGGSLREGMTALYQTADSNYVAGGYTRSWGAGNDDIYMVRLTRSLDTLYTKTIGTTNYEYLNNIRPNLSTGYILSGYKEVGAVTRAYIVNVTDKFDTLWTKDVGTTGYTNSILTYFNSDGTLNGYGTITKTNADDAWAFRLNYYTVTTKTISKKPGAIFDIPVMFYQPDGTSITSFQMSVIGNHKKLKFLGVSDGNSLLSNKGWSLLGSTTDTSVVVAAAGAANISGHGVLFNVKVQAVDTVYGTANLKFSNVTFNTGTVFADKNDGLISIYKIVYGDVDQNSVVQAYDAAYILKYVVGQLPLSEGSLINANVSGDTTVSAMDASVVLGYLVGLVPSLPHDTTGMRPSGNVSLRNAVASSNNKVLELPILANNVNNLFSFQGVINYDAEVLAFKSFSLEGNASSFASLSNDKVGSVTFAAAGISPVNVSGKLGKIVFDVKGNLFDKKSSIALKSFRMNEAPIELNLSSIEIGGSGSPLAVNDIDVPRFDLEQNYPNPFNPSTTIKFSLENNCNATITLYDVQGNVVKVLASGEFSSGKHSVTFDASGIASGVYFYKLVTPQKSAVKKLMFIK